LDFFGARYFSSISGRFTSVDPILSSGEVVNPQTWNKYSYTLNNPLSSVDIYGLYVYGDGATDTFKAQFEGWLKGLETARDSFDKNSKQYKRLNRIREAYGERGQGGPVIRVAETTLSGKSFDGTAGAETNWNNDGTISQSVTFKGSFLAAAEASGQDV